MRVVHEPAAGDSEQTLATRVEIADSLVSKGRGLMFRRSIPDEYALVFPFDREQTRGIHMLFVPFPIDAVWSTERTVTAVRELSAWTGVARETGDTLIEFPAGTADGIEPGDGIDILE